MSKLRTSAGSLLVILSLLALIGLLIPGSPAYLPSLLVDYSHYQDGHSLGYWVRALNRADGEVRLRSIHALGAIGPHAADAVPALARIVTEDQEDKAREEAALALSKIAPASVAAVPFLARALDEDYVHLVRMNAAIALSKLGPLARPAVPALIRATQRRINRSTAGSFTCNIQEMAALALGRATAGTPEGVSALVEALKSARTARKRRLVAQALAEVGAPAREAAPRLKALLNDESPEVRETAKEALRKILGDQDDPGA
jgi:HEAT repeat protein